MSEHIAFLISSKTQTPLDVAYIVLTYYDLNHPTYTLQHNKPHLLDEVYNLGRLIDISNLRVQIVPLQIMGKGDIFLRPQFYTPIFCLPQPYVYDITNKVLSLQVPQEF